MQKRMFKVVCPVEKPGGTWWMKCGTGFENRDESINLLIDVLPLNAFVKNEGIKLHVREYTEAELRERAEKKERYRARTQMDPNGLPASMAHPSAPPREPPIGRSFSNEPSPY